MTVAAAKWLQQFADAEPLPNQDGHFGAFGGRYVAETLMPLIQRVEAEYMQAKREEAFNQQLRLYLKNYVGRPSPLFFAENITRAWGGGKVYFKREDLNHTGAHKINNCLGQVLLAVRMGCKRIIAETGAGQHGVATATVCALLNLPCVVYMGALDMRRQQPNVVRMELLGAEVRPVKEGSASLKDAMNAALRDWTANVADTFYVIGSVAGPHPYPQMVRDFQTVIGEEVKEQMMQKEGRLPDLIIACVGGGSNAMGIFYPFLTEPTVHLVGVEAAGKGLMSGKHAAAISGGEVGVLHGSKSYYLQDEGGQILEAHSISAGLDYPGVGPEHAYLHQTGRVEYLSATDQEALHYFKFCTAAEGILPALEPAHALARAHDLVSKLTPSEIAVINMCGRGDKDMAIITASAGSIT